MEAKTSSKVIATFGIVFGLMMLLMTISLTNNKDFPYTFAQKNNVTKVKDTFTLSGPISSLVYVPSNNTNTKNANVTGQLDNMSKFVLSGNWSLSTKKGEITNF